jgi:hypothetical protein
MPNAWDIADSVLQQQLAQWRDFVLTEPDYTLHLFKNDYTPVPGSALGDYVEADFPGYAADTIPNTEWGTVTVAAHVASMTQTEVNSFEANAAGFVSQTVYGYYVTGAGGAFLWGERFENTKTIEPEDTLNVTPIMRHGVLPVP